MDFTDTSSQMEDFNLRRDLKMIYTNLGKLSEKKTVVCRDRWRLRSVENTEGIQSCFYDSLELDPQS